MSKPRVIKGIAWCTTLPECVESWEFAETRKPDEPLNGVDEHYAEITIFPTKAKT